MVRSEASLLYFNVEFVRERLLEVLSAHPDPVRLFVFFFGAVPRIDLAGAELLAELHKTFQARGVEFRLADANRDVRDALQRIGFEREYGTLESSETVDGIVSKHEKTAGLGAR